MRLENPRPIIYDPLTREKRRLLDNDILRAAGAPFCMGCMKHIHPANMAPSGFCWSCIYAGRADKVLNQRVSRDDLRKASSIELGAVLRRTKRILRGLEKGYKGVDK